MTCAFKGRLTYKDIEYTSKDSMFERLMTFFPVHRRSAELRGVQAPRGRWCRRGGTWSTGPARASRPRGIEAIAESRGELSVAKQVRGDRRVQLSVGLPCGPASLCGIRGSPRYAPRGAVLPFSSCEEARGRGRDSGFDYARHAQAARDIRVFRRRHGAPRPH